MAKYTKVKIQLDESVAENDFFKTKKSIRLTEQHIFKYGIQREEVPDHIEETACTRDPM